MQNKMQNKMQIREPCAFSFYAAECDKKHIEQYVKEFKPPEKPSKIVAGIVPHAGWIYSGAVSSKVFKCIKEKNKPDTFILFGAIHTLGVERNSVYGSGSWATPFGNVEVDKDTADILLDALDNQLIEDKKAHLREHSIEVQVPFIKYFFPEAKIVPISIIPDNKSALIGKEIGKIALQSKKEIVVIGTSDLTHYGDAYGFTPRGYGSNALKWLKENDARIIKLALEMKSEEIVREASNNYNACGSGAMAAAVSAAKEMGAKKGILIEHTTSYEVSREKEFYMGVGYAGIIF